MEYFYAGIILLFLCSNIVWYFITRSLLKLAVKACKGVEPPPIKSPMQIINEAKERKEAAREAKAEDDIWQQIQDCDGFTPAEREQVYRGENK